MNLSNEASSVVLQKMIEEGTITESEVERIANKFPSETMQLSVDTIHGLMCKSDDCHYSQEEHESDNPWLEREHRHWLGFVKDVMFRNSIEEESLHLAIEGFRNIYKIYYSNKESGGAELFDLWRDM